MHQYVANRNEIVWNCSVDSVADLLLVVDFQQSRPCWIQLCRQCVPGFIYRPSSVNIRREPPWHGLRFIGPRRTEGLKLTETDAFMQIPCHHYQFSFFAMSSQPTWLCCYELALRQPHNRKSNDVTGTSLTMHDHIWKILAFLASVLARLQH